MSTTEAPTVNVNRRDGSSTYAPTVTIPLDHVLGAEADPEIEHEMWRAWAFGRHSMWRPRIFGTDGEYRVPDPGVRFYNPRHSCAHKAVVVRLRGGGLRAPGGGGRGPGGRRRADQPGGRGARGRRRPEPWPRDPGTDSEQGDDQHARGLLLRPTRRRGGPRTGPEGRPHRGASVPAVRPPRPPALPRPRRPTRGVREGGAKVAREARRRDTDVTGRLGNGLGELQGS